MAKREDYAYRFTTRDDKVFISQNGRRVTTLSGSAAASFVADIDGGEDVQMIMARAAGGLRGISKKPAVPPPDKSAL